MWCGVAQWDVALHRPERVGPRDATPAAATTDHLRAAISTALLRFSILGNRPKTVLRVLHVLDWETGQKTGAMLLIDTASV